MAGLPRSQRAALYAAFGWAVEVVFTGLDGLRDPERRSPRLEGHSYIWMGPIYGSAAWLYEPLHDGLRRRPGWQRALAYGAGFIAAEYGSGMALRRLTGVIPWDYTGRGPLVIQGATRLDYLPLWMALGLVMEPLDDRLRGRRG